MNYSQLIEWFEECASIGQMSESVRFECDWVEEVNQEENEEVSIHYPYIHLTPPEWVDDIYSNHLSYNIIYYVVANAFIDESQNVKRSFADVITELQTLNTTYMRNLFNTGNQIEKYGEGVLMQGSAPTITPSEKLTTAGDYFLMVRMRVSSPTERC